jgi:retron-type reverse transcriptase
MRCNTTLITNQYKLRFFHRRGYSTKSFDVLKRLEQSKRDLETILVPPLKQNVLDYKRDKNTVWILDNKNIESSNIKLGIKLYISICTFLIAIKTSITFTRYLDMSFNSSDIVNYGIEDYSLPLPYVSDLKKIHRMLDKFNGYTIKSIDPVIFNPRNRFGNVYREKLADPTNWKDILDISRDNLENIIFKFWAVELTQTTNGANTASKDGIAFKSKGKKFHKEDKEKAKEYLATKYKYLNKILSLSKGNTDQSIKRKGKVGLTDREKLRRYLKSYSGKKYITDIRIKIKYMKNSPVNYANELYWTAQKHNNNLKFDLCRYIRNSKLKNYKSKDILRVYIPKANGMLRPLGIPSIYDRCLQNLLKLVMEPYMEPLSDEMSFGFRPGRNCHQATSYIHHRLVHYRSNKSLTLKEKAYLDIAMKLKYKKLKKIKGKVDLSKIDPKNNIKVTIPGFGDNIVRRRQILAPQWLVSQVTNKTEKIFYDTQYIIDADIKSCFDNISHSWLIKNVPMPTNYEHLLPKILKTTILEEDNSNNPYSNYTITNCKNYKVVIDKSDIISGIPQGGIISPLLMIWTLNGLQHHVKISAHNLGAEHKLHSIDRINYLKTKDLESKGYVEKDAYYRNKARIEWYNTTWFVSYADDFLVGVKSEIMAKLLIEKINEFLTDRGLELSQEKTKIIPWKIGNHVNFLGWTHSLIKPKKVSWMYTTSKQKAGKLIDWIGTYTYPSRESTKRFREQIKLLTSNINSYIPIDQTFKSINSLIRGWSNYFSPAPHQIHLRRHLDTYVWKRLRKLFMNKYAHSFHDIFIQHFTREVESWNKKAFYHKKSASYRMWLESPSIRNTNLNKGNLRSSSINVLNLTKLNMPSMWTFLIPNYDLLHNSVLVNDSAYIKRALMIAKFRRDTHSNFSFKQNHICPICNKSLINFNALLEVNPTYLEKYIYGLNNDLSTAIYENDLSYTNKEEESHNISNKEIKTQKRINIPLNKNTYWLGEVVIDHILPKAIAGYSHELSNILNRNLNLQLIHKVCHNIKGLSNQPIITEYRKIKKVLLPNKLDTYKEEELIEATFKIILQIDKLGLFKEYNKEIVAQLLKVSKERLPKLKRKSKSSRLEGSNKSK